MTIRVAPATIIGGPLDGHERAVATKWPAYLDEAGNVLPAFKGDRIMRHRPHAGFPKACYVHRFDWETGLHTYEYVSPRTP